MTSRLLVLRRASVILLVLWTALLVAAFLERRFRQTPQTEPAEAEAPAKEGLGQPVRVHKGFVYSDTLGIEPNFRIAAREAVEFASGVYEFSDVQVSLYHEGRVAYGLVADRLRFDPASHEAETSGRAEVSLQGGIALRAAGFKFGGKDRLLESQGPATFAGPGWGGLAGGARCSLEKDTLELTGGTSVTWRGSGAASDPSWVLLAPSLIYDRKLATIEFDDGLTVLRGRMRARTARAELQLSGPEGELRAATLGGPVRLDGRARRRQQRGGDRRDDRHREPPRGTLPPDRRTGGGDRLGLGQVGRPRRRVARLHRLAPHRRGLADGVGVAGGPGSRLRQRPR